MPAAFDVRIQSVYIIAQAGFAESLAVITRIDAELTQEGSTHAFGIFEAGLIGNDVNGQTRHRQLMPGGVDAHHLHELGRSHARFT